MIQDAEKFLVSCVSPRNVETFDELRNIVYHEKHLKFDIERFPLPPTSGSIREHILRAYLQCFMWLHALFVESFSVNPLDYGLFVDEDGNLLPLVSREPSLPNDFPFPCNCLKCAKQTVCPCRVKEIPCCQYCKNPTKK